MPERRPSLRAVMGLAVFVVGAVEVQTLVQAVRSQARIRDRVLRSVREQIVAARPRLGAALMPGGAESWVKAAQEAIASSLASEVEVYDAKGVRLFAHPSTSPVEHWPEAAQLAPQPAVITLGPFTGEATRVLTYASFRSGDRLVTLRLSTAVPDLIADLRERREVLIGHGIALGVLILAGGLVLFPVRGTSDPSHAGALEAYERAMERLRDHGQEQSRLHQDERRRMEEELRGKEAMARAGELTAGIVHEMRNGLGTIVGYARLLERDAASPEVRETARSVRDECETLEGVVRRFMEFVKEDTLNLSPLDAGRMLSRVVARESRSREGARVEVAPSDGVTLVGDEELLERAFENLVRNAREASGAAGLVAIGLKRVDGQVLITIADDGPGLPASMGSQPRPFFTTKAGGLGLGLPLAQKIVRLHDGRMEFSANGSRGLIVTVRLPQAGPSPA